MEFWIILGLIFLLAALSVLGDIAEYNAFKKQCEADDKHYDKFRDA